MNGAPSLDAPTPTQQRIVALDVLRGVAVLGILIVNITYFAGPMAWADAPRHYAELTPAGETVWMLVEVFATYKFVTLFSLMFGAGLWMMARRDEQRGRSVRACHYRRMVGLAVIGLAHGALIWYADILFTYAVLGSIVFLMRRWSARSLLIAASVAVGIGMLAWGSLGALMFLFRTADPAAYAQALGQVYTPEDIAREIAAYSGGYVGQFSNRLPVWAMMITALFLYWSLWMSGGLMLAGMAYYKLGLITGEAPAARYRLLAGLLLPLGLLVSGMLAYLHWAGSVTVLDRYTWMMAPASASALMISTGYLSLIMLWVRSGTLPWLRHALACAGRMALTLYLMQSVMCTFIFYGHGLGLFAQLDRVAQLGVVLAVWVVELLAAMLWLKWMRQGPFEWLWRAWTYLSLPPLRGGAGGEGS